MTGPTRAFSHSWLDTFGAMFAVLLVGIGSLAGVIVQSVSFVMIGAAVVQLLSRLWGLRRKDLQTGFVRAPLSPTNRSYLGQMMLRVALLATWGLLLLPTFSLLGLFGAEAVWQVGGLVGVTAAGWLAFALVPRRRVGLTSTVVCVLATLSFGGLWLSSLWPSPEAEIELGPPMCGESAVLQGGPSVLENHHFVVESQRYALDLVALSEDGLAATGDGETLDDFVCFGLPVVAPLGGKVVRAKDTLPDQPIGSTDFLNPVGNHVVLEADGQFILLAHLQAGSVVVEEGQSVDQGQVLGRCGNSGNTTMPHLHLQVQSGPDLFGDEPITTIPMGFAGPAAPRRGDTLPASVSTSCATAR